MPVDDPVFSGDQVRHDVLKSDVIVNYDTVSQGTEYLSGIDLYVPVLLVLVVVLVLVLETQKKTEDDHEHGHEDEYEHDYKDSNNAKIPRVHHHARLPHNLNTFSKIMINTNNPRKIPIW